MMNPLQDITNKTRRIGIASEEQFFDEIIPGAQTLTRRTLNNDDDSSPPPSPSSPPVESSPRRRSSRRFRRNVLQTRNDRTIRFPARSSLFLKSSSCDVSSLDDDELTTEEEEDEEDEFRTCELSNQSLISDCSSCSCPQDLNKKQKRQRLSLPPTMDQGKVFKKMHPLSKNQLIDLVCSVSKISLGHKEKYDRSVFFRRLKILQKNINKAMPDRVYGMTRDAVSFKRVEVHLLLFKQECLKQCRSMFELAQWLELFGYVTSAIHLVADLPVWQNTSHNLHREHLFRILSSYCRKLMTLSNFDDVLHCEIKERLSECSNYHPALTKLFKDADRLLQR